ncbi:hypothetical protein NQ317_002054 [Molorchus minor]|uniref:MADF domain-containing protein n=1 Tax=Molorchus minor TaxID=1323400 RepID=A0ABQ9JDX1_9CUCU|nr:hypothetical protein NQ317_002054 [Molorchus minor]
MLEQIAPTDQERFVKDLITAFREQPVLWDKNNPQHKSRAERTEAYQAITEKCREYFPEADEDFVKEKLDSLRSTFRRERHKVLKSKAMTAKPEDVYNPSLWYYNLLLFTVGEEPLGDFFGQESLRQYLSAF